MRRANLKTSEYGFTLLELAVVLTILALLIAGGLVLGTSQLEQGRLRDTQTKLNAVEEALAAYVVAFHRLPCPADLTLAPDNASAGKEVADTSGCTTSTGIFHYQSGAIEVFEGMVPARTLQLPDNYMLDGWGRRITYAVDGGSASLSSPLPFETGGEKFDANAAGDISVDVVGGNCASTATLRADAAQPAGGTPIGALYILFSHGMNGHGAWFKQGGTLRVNANMNQNSEYENSHYTVLNVDDGSFNNCFVQGELTVSNTATPETTTFDDILRFKTRWQLSIE